MYLLAQCKVIDLSENASDLPYFLFKAYETDEISVSDIFDDPLDRLNLRYERTLKCEKIMSKEYLSQSSFL